MRGTIKDVVIDDDCTSTVSIIPSSNPRNTFLNIYLWKNRSTFANTNDFKTLTIYLKAINSIISEIIVDIQPISPTRCPISFARGLVMVFIGDVNLKPSKPTMLWDTNFADFEMIPNDISNGNNTITEQILKKS
jgi:hypothetical protein